MKGQNFPVTLPEWFSKLDELRKEIRKQEKTLIVDDPGKRIKKPKEEVVNSPVIKWKPIDRVAALVTAKALWIHKPDAFTPPKVEKPKPPKKKKKPKMKENMERVFVSENPIPHANMHMVIKDGPEYDQWIKNACLNLLDELEKNPGGLKGLAKAMFDARKSLDESLLNIGGVQDEFNSKVKMFLTDVRSTRMAAVAEASSMIQPLKDIRQFFLGPDYSEQISRLKEFVELCEKLKKLKESGFLDGMADTLLKLS